ncbi:hypothetical protein [Saccharothrix espanaensis]|uniref:hypothetical protein n=1 Tax=Saccharothrix espanaensis TaxID=103731 RepID=UPI0011DDD7A6|nr:hypothetical protein [Saccharothrix espanaensis]
MDGDHGIDDVPLSSVTHGTWIDQEREAGVDEHPCVGQALVVLQIASRGRPDVRVEGEHFVRSRVRIIILEREDDDPRPRLGQPPITTLGA